jgi:hypothetical protein
MAKGAREVGARDVQQVLVAMVFVMASIGPAVGAGVCGYCSHTYYDVPDPSTDLLCQPLEDCEAWKCPKFKTRTHVWGCVGVSSTTLYCYNSSQVLSEDLEAYCNWDNCECDYRVTATVNTPFGCSQTDYYPITCN